MGKKITSQIKKPALPRASPADRFRTYLQAGVLGMRHFESYRKETQICLYAWDIALSLDATMREQQIEQLWQTCEPLTFGQASTRTKEMLLPLTTAKVRTLSLENHLALATVRAGRGDFDQICCLIRVVYLAYFLRGETVAGGGLEPYRRAEAALDACIKRIEQNQACLLLDQEHTVVERVLALHDDQLAVASKFRYLEAWEQLQRFISSRKHSPIPAGADS